MVFRFLPLMIVAAMLAVNPAPAAERLRIGTEGSYPPFNEVTADGRLEGFDIDIANALCAKMKVECEFVVQDWDGLIPALQAGKFDAIVASLSITPERRKQVAFTRKYYETPFSLVVPKDSRIASTDPAALAGKTVGAQASSVLGAYVQDVYGKAGAEPRLYPSQEDAMTDLVNGRLDAVVSDKFMLVDWLKKEGRNCCRMVGDIAGTETPAGIAVRLGDEALRDRLDAALDAILADGTYKKIRSKYFDFDIY